MRDETYITFRGRDSLPNPPSGKCEAFALCENAPTGTRRHPILGEVPICDRCRAQLDELEDESR